MNAIEKNVILAQFDRTQKYVTAEAGRVIKPEDAERAAQKLNSAGDGEAAFAVQTATALAAKVNAAAGGRLSKADFQRVREEMEADIDRVNSGFETLGPRELSRLKTQYRPLVSALIEMSRTEAFSANLPALETFGKALDRLKEILVAAAGEDHVMTPKESRAIAKQLRGAGRHTEAFAVENFFTIADKRSGPSKDASTASIESAIEWARGQISERLASGRTADMPETWMAVARLGQAIEAGVLEPFVPNQRAGDFEKYKTLSEDQKFEVSWKISDNDVGGVNQVGGVPASVLEKMRPAVDSHVAELAKDGWAVAERSEDTQTVKNSEGLYVPASHSTYVRLQKAGQADLALEYFWSTRATDMGARVIDPQPEGLIGPPKYQGDSSDYPVPSRWRPDVRLTDTEVQQRFAADPSDRTAALANLARIHLLHGLEGKRDDHGVVHPDGDTDMWEVGTATRRGKSYDIVRWADSSDSSYTLWFSSEKVGQTERFRLMIENFDN